MMDWWETDMKLESEKPKEILMILQPRAIPEAIESLNALDIEKVWFRGYTEVELETHLNEFIQTTDYDYYWIIADDVIVDENPIELLRPLLHEGKVVSGYCLLGGDTDLVNLSNSENMTCTPYFDVSLLNYFYMMHQMRNSSRYNVVSESLTTGKISQPSSTGSFWIDNLLENNIKFEDAVNDEVNLCVGVYDDDFMTRTEVKNSKQNYFTTKFTGWSFTGMSREIWLKYPYQTSSKESNTDAQFSLRYAIRGGNEIWTHKDAEHIHLKKTLSKTEKSNWIVGVEEPVIHFGDGKLVGENIPSELVWRLGDGEEE